MLCGNSLNYALVEANDQFPILLAVMNSWVLDFVFRTKSRTNHITAEELHELPFPNLSEAPPALIQQLTQTVRELSENGGDRRAIWSNNLFENLQAMVFDIYQLTNRERNIILDEYARPSRIEAP